MRKTTQIAGIVIVTLLCAGPAPATVFDENFEAANGFTDGGGVDGVHGWVMPAGAITAETHVASAGFAVRDLMAVRCSSTGGYMYPYRNFTAQPEVSKEEIKRNLLEQLTSTVLWSDCVEFMVAKGVDIFFEIGPSKVLRSLIRKIAPQAKVINLEKKEDFNAV